VKASNDTAILAEQEELALNQRNAGRKQSLAQSQIVNANSLDELQTKVRESELKIREAVTEQRIAQLTASRSAAQLALKQIRASVDGVVTERKLSPGEYVYEQTPIMTIAQIDPLNVELVLSADRYGSIRVGDRALVQPAQPVGGSYEAQVVVVDPVIDAASSTFGVRLLLPNPGTRIPAGLRCGVVWHSAPQATRTTP
jgi:membrane fusion protein (multidrug efflux system)